MPAFTCWWVSKRFLLWPSQRRVRRYVSTATQFFSPAATKILSSATSSSHIISRVLRALESAIAGADYCSFSSYKSLTPVISCGSSSAFSFKNVCQRDPSRSVGSGAFQISGLSDIVAPTSRLLWEHIALKRSISCGLVGFRLEFTRETVGCGLLHIQSVEVALSLCASVSHSAHL
jgi:hypothetical protein